MYMVSVAFFDSPLRAPAIVFYLSEEFTVVSHHPGTAVSVMIQGYKSSITETVLPKRYVLR
jgi:hypothetical protein